MTINIEFFIHRVHVLPDVEGISNVVARAEWRAILSRNGIKSIAAGDTLLDTSTLDPTIFVPVYELSSDQLIQWIIDTEGGEDFVNHLKAIHAPYLARKELEAKMQLWEFPLVNPRQWDDAYAR